MTSLEFILLLGFVSIRIRSNPFESVRIRSNPLESFPLSASEDILDLDIGPDRESGHLLTSLRQENLSQRSIIRAGHASFFCVTASSGKNYQVKKLSTISVSPSSHPNTGERSAAPVFIPLEGLSCRWRNDAEKILCAQHCQTFYPYSHKFNSLHKDYSKIFLNCH